MSLNKKIIISIVIVISIILLTITGFFIAFQFSKISYDKTEHGMVQSDIVITRTEEGVPHITASNEDDLFFALGYVHAQDRLNMIEYQRALATGNAGNFIGGQDGELLNRLSSIIGFTLEAETLYEKLDDITKKRITRYAEGINHIRHTRHLTKIGRTDWTPFDVLSLLIMKEWTDAYLSNTELLFPFSETKKNLIIKTFPSPDKFSFYKDDESQYMYVLQRVRGLVERYIGRFNDGFAAYVPSSLNPADDRSFCAFSYTSDYNVYPGWYPVNIKTEGLQFSAVTFNGLPFFFSYKKDGHFFSHFTITADSQDFHLFSTRKNDSDYQYNIRGTWKNFNPVRIPDGADRSLHTIRWITDKGAILSDLIASEKKSEKILCINSVIPGANYIRLITGAPFENDNLKLKNMILSSDSSLKGFLIKTDKEALKIYAGFVSTPDNDRKVITDGSFNVKPDFRKIVITKNITDADFIGSDLTNYKDIPVLRPGSLITNNLKLARMQQIFPAKQMYTEEAIYEIITDTHSQTAQIFVPLFQQILETAPITSAKMTKIYFGEWDYSSKYKLQAPAIFFTTIYYLIDETFRDELGNDTDTLLHNSDLIYDDFYQIFNKNLTGVFDNIKTDQIETRETIFDKAFLKSLRYLSRKEGPLMDIWRWGDLNQNYYKIPNITNSIFSVFFKMDQIQTNGSSDSLYCSVLSQDFSPVSATSLVGVMADNRFRFRVNYGYSSSIVSRFYYGNMQRAKFDSQSESEESYRQTILP